MTLSANRAHAAQRRILLVDGNIEVLELLSILLKHYGHAVATAKGGAEALSIATEFHPEAVFLGVVLPDCSGYDLAPRLRKLPGAETCLLVALTGYGQREDFQGRNNAGFDHFLLKPANIDAIVGTLERFKPVAIEVERSARSEDCHTNFTITS